MSTKHRILPLSLRQPLFVLLSLCAVLWSLSAVDSNADDPVLSEEGLQRRAAHAFLFDEFAPGRKLTVTGDGDAAVLQEIVVCKPQATFEKEMALTLPEGSARVAGMFRYLVLKGEHLDALEGLTLLPFAPDSHMHRSTQGASLYRVQMAALPAPSATMPQLQVKSHIRGDAKVVVTEVLFNSQGRLGIRFDDIPYRNLGAEYPRERVAIELDVARELSVAGTVDLQRQKWFRYYAVPGGVDRTLERWALERKFLPGRQITKLQPSLVVGYSPNQPRLRELAGQPGKPDLSFFDRYDAGGHAERTIPEFRQIRYALCFDDWPKFMSRQPNGRGTPLVEHFDDAAELAAAFVRDQVRDNGRSATWWEVKNESTIKAEWDYHWLPNVDSWQLLADLHNRVADAIHQRAPGTLVGGPSSAWMQVQVKDFELYRNQTRFMDLTRGKLDFYSHHFYENIGSLGAYERRKTQYTNYLLGRLEAIFDMLRAHMHKTDNVRPMLVTECGSLQAGRSPSDNWLRLRSYNAYLVKMMQRPDQIDLVVPFVFLSIPWNPTSGDAAFTPKPGRPANGAIGDFNKTAIASFFELWRDFHGRRLPVRCAREWVDVVAVHDRDAVRLAITNMGGRRLVLDLQKAVEALPIESIVQRRLYYENGTVQYVDAIQLPNASSIPLNVEETTIVVLELSKPLDVQAVVRRDRFYANDTAVSVSEAPMEQVIEIDSSTGVAAAELVIGIHRDGGLAAPVVGTLNGHPFQLDVPWADDMQHLFAPAKMKVPASWLQLENRLVVQPVPGLTITSLQLVIDR